MTRFYERGALSTDSGSLPVVECADCGALVVRDNEQAAEEAHRAFHARIEDCRHR